MSMHGDSDETALSGNNRERQSASKASTQPEQYSAIRCTSLLHTDSMRTLPQQADCSKQEMLHKVCWFRCLSSSQPSRLSDSPMNGNMELQC
jgi:hypothetical protein